MTDMKGFLGLTKRNLLLFFKDKQAILFSLLTSIIVLVLYLLFLKSSYVDAMNNVIASNEGLSFFIKDEDVNMYANLILLTGILGSAMITVPYNCLTNVVRDRESKIDYDILATPIKRGKVVLSYFVSAALSSVILNGIILTAGLLMIGAQGSLYMNAFQILAVYGIVALGSVSATAFFIILVIGFKSSNASGAFFGILSAASGFVIGAYIPISQFSEKVQTVCNIFPASHITITLRNLLMNGLLGHMDSSLGGVDNGMFVSTIKNLFGFNAHMFNKSVSISGSLIYVVAVIGLCIVAQTILFSKTYRKK